ncbi:MAG: hypothetical protein ACT4O5_08215 [Gammaproteobacteria bacterium]
MPLGPIDDPSAVAKSIPALAKDIMAVYRETDRRLFLDNLFRLQLVAGDDEAAAKTTESLRVQEASDSSLVSKTRHLQFAILAQARARQAADKVSFESAFEQAFRDAFACPATSAQWSINDESDPYKCGLRVAGA